MSTLFAIEPLPAARIVRAVNAEGIVDARAATPHEDVPEVEGLVAERIEPDGLDRLDGRGAIEQQQDDLGRRLREQREIDAPGTRRRTRRMRGARLDLKRWMRL